MHANKLHLLYKFDSNYQSGGNALISRLLSVFPDHFDLTNILHNLHRFVYMSVDQLGPFILH